MHCKQIWECCLPNHVLNPLCFITYKRTPKSSYSPCSPIITLCPNLGSQKFFRPVDDVPIRQKNDASRLHLFIAKSLLTLSLLLTSAAQDWHSSSTILFGWSKLGKEHLTPTKHLSQIFDLGCVKSFSLLKMWNL